jgi:hypothetical protein
MNENNRIRPDVPLNDADGERIEERRIARRDPLDQGNTSMIGPLLAGLAVLALLVGAFYFWPRDAANTNVTQNAPRVERPNAPPAPSANKPAPTPQPEAPK